MKKKLFQAFIFTLFILATLQPPVDLDLGWHLRYGQYFFQTGHVLKDNTLSYVWPDYKWIQASWGYDLLVYQIFTRTGFLGLTLSAILFTLIIFWLVAKPVNRFSPFQLFFLVVIFLSQTVPLYIDGLRSQTPSTLFFAAVLVIAHSTLSPSGKKSFLNSKAQFLLPLLFLLWANTHGGFTLGLAVIGILWLGHGLLMLINHLSPRPQSNTINIKNWLIFSVISIGCIITPLINPWGAKIYEETFKHSTTINLTGISEWKPLTRNIPASLIAALITILVFILTVLKKKTSNIPYLLAFILITILAFAAIRFLILFGVMTTYFLSQNMLETELPFPKWTNSRLLRASLKGLVIFFIFYDVFVSSIYFSLPNFSVFNFSWKNYCDLAKDCSEEVAKSMLNLLPQGNGYNPYNFGGYLSWRVPQVKTFVDGRMAAWANGAETPPIKENDQIIHNGGAIPFRQLDNIYHFRWVIIQTPTQTGQYLEALTRTGLWKKQYQDQFYSLYLKVGQ